MKTIIHYISLFVLTSIFMFVGQKAEAQIEFTNCQNAFPILDPIDWCSGPAAFNNVAIGASGYGAAGCWTDTGNDFWLEFTAFSTAVSIVVDGEGNGNTLGNISAALYTGDCGGVINELNCIQGFNIVSMFETALIPGTKYYIRIDGPGNGQGAFEVCVKNFNPPVEPGQDCPTASILCDKSPFVVETVTGSGNIPNEVNSTCILSENQSTWFKWTAANNGDLTFTITPLQLGDDLDFALFEIPDIESCALTSIRCVASSCDSEEGLPSGINLESTDLEEDFNCEPGEDNFVRFIDMVEGQSYALIINNFSSSGLGFNMEWGGSGEFLGPDPEFDIIPDSGLSCDQAFEIVNLTTAGSGFTIVSYNWTFGERAVPLTSTAENPGPVIYEKFGEKFIVLEVTTDKGCIVTEVQPLFAEPCCNDIFDVGINVLDVNDLTCPGIPDGSFTIEGFGGNPEYEFDINGADNFSVNQLYDNLAEGTYQVNVQDIKGCFDSIMITLGAPDPVVADAGPDQSTTLGFNAELDGSFDDPNANVTILWTSSPVDTTMSCFDCLNPTVTPPGTTTYFMQVTDENGCVTIDEVIVRVKLERPVYGPNVFSPNGDGRNDFFTLFTNKAAFQIDLLRVYDRWGNKVYEGTDLPLNDPTIGWDGQFNGQPVKTGVFGWYAEITFIDNITADFKGDVTVIR